MSSERCVPCLPTPHSAPSSRVVTAISRRTNCGWSEKLPACLRPRSASRCTLYILLAIRVSVAIQLVSHVLPPSLENDCSKWQEFGVMSEITNRTRIARPFSVS